LRKRTRKDGVEGSVAGSLTGFEDQVLDWLDRIEAWFNQFLWMFKKGKSKAMTELESEEDDDEEE